MSPLPGPLAIITHFWYMMKHASDPAFSLQRSLSSLKVSSADGETQICTIPLQRLQNCHLVSNRFLLYSELNSPVLKLRKLPTGNLVQTLKLLSNVIKLQASGQFFLAVMKDCSAVVRVEERLELLKLEKHCSNEEGAGAIVRVGEDVVVGHLDSLLGSVTVQWIGPKARKMTLVAHKNPISAIGLSASGLCLATVSTKGTLMRVFDTVSGQQTREIRLSFTPQQITSLDFSPDDLRISIETSDGLVVLQGAEGRQGLLGMVPSFLLPAWQGARSCSTENQPLETISASWLEIE